MKHIKISSTNTINEDSVVRTKTSLSSLPDEIKAILKDDLFQNKENVNITRKKEVEKNETGYDLEFLNNSKMNLPKNKIQELINHPNFKSLNIVGIEFKYDYDLKG